MILRNPTRTKRLHPSTRGFTLVELLVVIGIIALLIGILLPSLQRARATAQSAACLSNLRSIGQAIAIYAGQNNGSLPYGFAGNTNQIYTSVLDNTKTDNQQSDWAMLLLSNVYNKGDGTWFTTKYMTDSQAMFTCASADLTEPMGSLINRRLHYGVHPRLMPILNFPDPAYPSHPPMKPYKVGHVQRSSEVMLMWDAEQCFDTGYYHTYGNAAPVSDNLDGSAMYVATESNGQVSNYLLSGATSTGTSVVMDFPISTAPLPTSPAIFNPANQNASQDGFDIQWRHGTGIHNATANFLFVDGHAESMALNFHTNCDVKCRNICVNPQ